MEFSSTVEVQRPWRPPYEQYARSKMESMKCSFSGVTGMGRTGKMFSVEHYSVVPDIIVLGRGQPADFRSDKIIN